MMTRTLYLAAGSAAIVLLSTGCSGAASQQQTPPPLTAQPSTPVADDSTSSLVEVPTATEAVPVNNLSSFSGSIGFRDYQGYRTTIAYSVNGTVWTSSTQGSLPGKAEIDPPSSNFDMTLTGLDPNRDTPFRGFWFAGVYPKGSAICEEIKKTQRGNTFGGNFGDTRLAPNGACTVTFVKTDSGYVSADSVSIIPAGQSVRYTNDAFTNGGTPRPGLGWWGEVDEGAADELVVALNEPTGVIVGAPISSPAGEQGCMATFVKPGGDVYKAAVAPVFGDPCQTLASPLQAMPELNDPPR